MYCYLSDIQSLLYIKRMYYYAIYRDSMMSNPWVIMVDDIQYKIYITYCQFDILKPMINASRKKCFNILQLCLWIPRQNQTPFYCLKRTKYVNGSGWFSRISRHSNESRLFLDNTIQLWRRSWSCIPSPFPRRKN